MSVPTDRDIRFGDDVITDTAKLVTAAGSSRVLLVCGAHAFEASGADRCLGDLEQVAEVRRWSDFHPNTDSVDLLRGLRVIEEFQPDLVLGIGGGSAMDMSKLLCAYQGITEESALREAIQAGAAVTRRDLSMILGPTTSGSGSEATRFAVVYIGDDKYSIAGDAMLPDSVILDPVLTISASPYQRATSGIDAVAQATESLWAAGATGASRDFAREALRLLVPALPTFVASATAESAAAMAQGSHLAGRAIDVSRTTAAHALSYGFTKLYGISHGHAVALTLGNFIADHAAVTGEENPARLQSVIDPAVHRAVMADVLAAFDAGTAQQARQNFTQLAQSCGLSLSLPEVGVTDRTTVAELTARVNVERLGNNPVSYTAEQLTDLVAQGI